MEKILFYSYLRYQKEKNVLFYKALFLLPWPAILLLGLTSLISITGIVFSFVAFLKPYTWLCLIAEAIICLITYFYTEHYQIENSKQRLRDYKFYCSEVLECLNAQGFSTNHKNLQEIKERILNIIFKKEQRKKNKSWSD